MRTMAPFLGLALVVMTVSSVAADKRDAEPPASAPRTTNAPNEQVIAYYFHGTVRCVECLKIEQQAREVVERRFEAELATKRLVFKPVNYDLPENAHFLRDYKLPCPSLVLVQRKGGKDVRWKLLGDTWQLIHNPIEFTLYVENEVDKFLQKVAARSAPDTAKSIVAGPPLLGQASGWPLALRGPSKNPRLTRSPWRLPREIGCVPA